MTKNKKLIKGTIEFIQNEETTIYYDRYSVKVDGIIKAYVYIHKSAYLVPQTITFTEELEVHDVY